MLDYTLPAEKLREWHAEHRAAHEKREADRIKAVVLLERGWTAEEVAEALLIDPNTVRNHFRRCQQDGLAGLRHVAYGGSDCALDDGELAALDVHVQTKLYLTAKEVASWVKEQFDIAHTANGMTALLRRLDFVYRKPKLVPGKADPVAQEAVLADYEKLKQNNGRKRRHLLHGRGSPAAQPCGRVRLDQSWPGA